MGMRTTVSVSRKGVQLQTQVTVQIDVANPMMAAAYNNGHPFDMYKIYVLQGTMPYARGDLLKDEINQDPLTTQPIQYRVVGNPKQQFLDGHVELMAEQFAGKA